MRIYQDSNNRKSIYCEDKFYSDVVQLGVTNEEAYSANYIKLSLDQPKEFRNHLTKVIDQCTSTQ